VPVHDMRWVTQIEDRAHHTHRTQEEPPLVDLYTIPSRSLMTHLVCPHPYFHAIKMW
jgi:hypothetical protein